jgi:hypothetical protein
VLAAQLARAFFHPALQVFRQAAGLGKQARILDGNGSLVAHGAASSISEGIAVFFLASRSGTSPAAQNRNQRHDQQRAHAGAAKEASMSGSRSVFRQSSLSGKCPAIEQVIEQRRSRQHQRQGCRGAGAFRPADILPLGDRSSPRPRRKHSARYAAAAGQLGRYVNIQRSDQFARQAVEQGQALRAFVQLGSAARAFFKQAGIFQRNGCLAGKGRAAWI